MPDCFTDNERSTIGGDHYTVGEAQVHRNDPYVALGSGLVFSVRYG